MFHKISGRRNLKNTWWLAKKKEDRKRVAREKKSCWNLFKC